MPLIGIEPSLVLFAKSASIIYQFWLHTESIGKLPKWFEAIFNTPSHHRVHHASDVEYLDKNHAGTLIIWDKLFGTYQEETYKPTYGLTQNIHSFNPLVIEFHEWKNVVKDFKKSKDLNIRLQYLINAPGWSHDGSTQTTQQLQAGLKAKQQ
jgi:sterol desaturase/sphingolipid hydroxylase (fatty acid hydroxylase superfamily)